MANSTNLRFEDFAILEGVRGVVAGRRAFHSAIWAAQTHVTLALSVDCNQTTHLQPITEFCDLVPSHYLPLMPNPEGQMVQGIHYRFYGDIFQFPNSILHNFSTATISVLPRMFVDTLQSFGQMLRIRSDNLKHKAFNGSTMNLSIGGESTAGGSNSKLRKSVQNLSTFQDGMATSDLLKDSTADLVPSMPGQPSYDELIAREVGFVMLQLVNGLKTLQAKGIEELPISLSNVILCKYLENKDAQAKLCVLHG